MKCNLMILIIAVVLLSACAPAARSIDSGLPGIGGGAQPEAPVMAPSMPEVAENYAPQPAAPGMSAQERIVIQNFDLTIVVKDPRAKMTEIGALAKRLGGFVVSSNMSQVSIGDNRQVPEGTITIRVPSKDLESALSEIKTGIIELRSENGSGEDVTDKYVDLQSQLKARQAAADKLFELMEESRNASDTLAIFNELTRVQSEIEVLKGQINYYEQAAALSAISVRLLAEETIQPLTIAGWRPQGVARDAVQALINFFQNFASFLIWLVIYILPVGAVVIVLLALLWRLARWLWFKVSPRKKPAVVEKE